MRACHGEPEKKILGEIKWSTSGKAVENPEVKKMSDEQKKMRININTRDVPEKKKTLSN